MKANLNHRHNHQLNNKKPQTDGNDQQQAQPLSQKAITAFIAFNEFQQLTKYTPSDCVYGGLDEDEDMSCLKNKHSLDSNNKIEITGISGSNFEPDVHVYSNDNKYHSYELSSSTEATDVSLSLFTGNTVHYLENTDADQWLLPPFSRYSKGEDLIYVFIAKEFAIDEGTKLPEGPISINHGAKIVFKNKYIDQTKEAVQSTDDGYASHLKIEVHVENDNNTTSIYSTKDIPNSDDIRNNTHHNLTDETGTVVGSVLVKETTPVDGKPQIKANKIEFYDTNKDLF